MILFKPNCTIPPEPPVFVTAPNVRSTMNIVWSCTSTILLCCWSIQHLNVPPQFQPRTTRQKLMRKLIFFWRKVKWMMITLFAPEFLLAKAITNLRSCLLHSPILQEFADEDGVPWSKMHTFLADMGGFALRFPPSSHSVQCQCTSAPSVDVHAKIRPSSQMGFNHTKREGNHDIDATEEVQDRIRGRGSTGSLPIQFSPNSPQSQERLASTEAYDSAQITRKNEIPPCGLATSGRGTITQRELVDEPSPDIDLPSLLSTTEQVNRQAVTSVEPPHQKLQVAIPGKSVVKTWNKKRDWMEGRQGFRARVGTASGRFGDIAWKVSRHNANMAELFSGPPEPRDWETNVVSTLLTLEGDVWVLTAAQLIEARRRKLVAQLPHITEDELSDRNKGDLLLKILALLQVSWMAIQIIVRATLHVSSTPLEIMTLSFAACAFITYILLLNHPQDVQTSIYIDASRLSTIDDMGAIAYLSPIYYWFTTNRLPCIPNNAIHCPVREGSMITAIWFYAGLGAGAAVFGGAHLVAWNFVFPTVVERTLWRTSSLVTLLIPVATMMVIFQVILMWRFRGRSMQNYKNRWLQAVLGLSTLALVLARLFVIVEAFRSLYYLPRDAYFATWAANAPSIV